MTSVVMSVNGVMIFLLIMDFLKPIARMEEASAAPIKAAHGLDAEYVRVSFRYGSYADDRKSIIGFRLSRTVRL